MLFIDGIKNFEDVGEIRENVEGDEPHGALVVSLLLLLAVDKLLNLKIQSILLIQWWSIKLGELNTELVWYSSGQKEVGCQTVRFLKAI